MFTLVSFGKPHPLTHIGYTVHQPMTAKHLLLGLSSNRGMHTVGYGEIDVKSVKSGPRTFSIVLFRRYFHSCISFIDFYCIDIFSDNRLHSSSSLFRYHTGLSRGNLHLFPTSIFPFVNRNSIYCQRIHTINMFTGTTPVTKHSLLTTQ